MNAGVANTTGMFYQRIEAMMVFGGYKDRMWTTTRLKKWSHNG